MRLTRAVLEEMLRHCERAYPAEACGFLVGDPGGLPREVVPIRNVAEKLRAERPAEYTRGAEDGYVMDPAEQLAAMTGAEKAGRVLSAVWHSHPDVGAYFSGEDRARALFDGIPIFPDASWLVADVRQGKAQGVKAFRWDGRDFVEVPLEVE